MTETTGIDRGVVVADDLDEVAPECRPHPNDWIVRISQCGFGLAHPFDDEPTSSESRTLIDGQVVQFARLIDHGTAVLAVIPEMGWSVDRPMPPTAHLVCVQFDPETVSDSVSSLVADCNLDPGTYTIKYYDWPMERWAFDAVAGRFERLGEA